MWRRDGRSRVHAVVFGDPEDTLAAVRRLRAAGFEVKDVHTPFPVHGMEEALSLRRSRLPLATLVAAGLGGALKLAFQGWVHVVDWPYDIGGKPMLAFPALIPVTFEIAVLLGAFATLGAFLVRRRLYPRLRSGPPDGQPLPRVTDDRFVVLVMERDAGFSPGRFRAACRALGPVEVIEGWRLL